ncbi:MAG: 4Fe-4S binding protein [Chlorobium sp.]|nr:4Fe-4S binding protein [Chlorobium phaeovibrioides]NQU46500.1 4Fe-4S binding protein [Chlorobium sp.]
MKRQIITVDEALCTGCGDCIPGCPEGALQVIDGKARLVSDLLCDGLGACIGHCPTGAMRVEVREAMAYDEKKVMREQIMPKGPNVIKAHLQHLLDHGEDEYLADALACLREAGIAAPLEGSSSHAVLTHKGGGCSGSRTMAFGSPAGPSPSGGAVDGPSELTQWPVQLHLVSPLAPYFKGSDLLLAADCTAFAVGDFHNRFLRGKSLAVACPKLDSGLDIYEEKLTAMIDEGGLNTITALVMEVPCCNGLMTIVQRALQASSRKVPVKKVVIGVKGDILSDAWVEL